MGLQLQLPPSVLLSGLVDSLPPLVHQELSLFLERLVPQVPLVRLVLPLQHFALCRL